MESLDAKKFGGYDVYFLQEHSDKYECPICIMALCKPILTKCGHRLCLSCSEEMRKRNNGVLVCPLDNTILKPEETFRDKAIERDILQLKVMCNNFLKKCQWTGELKAINNHLGSCEYEEVKCLNEQCTTSILRKELSDHMETKCIYRLINCQHCNQKIHFCEKQNHLESCECLPLYCVNQCGTKTLRKEISSHIIDSCANTIIFCQYFSIGCNFKGMRKEQGTHVNSSTQNHLLMAISKVVALENKIMINEEEITSLKNEMEMRKKQDTQVDSLTQNQFLTTSKMIELENKILLIEKEMNTKMTISNNEKIYLPEEYIDDDYNNDNNNDEDNNDYNNDYNDDYNDQNEDYNEDYDENHNEDYNEDYNNDYNNDCNDYNDDCNDDFNNDNEDYDEDYNDDYNNDYNNDNDD